MPFSRRLRAAAPCLRAVPGLGFRLLPDKIRQPVKTAYTKHGFLTGRFTCLTSRRIFKSALRRVQRCPSKIWKYVANQTIGSATKRVACVDLAVVDQTLKNDTVENGFSRF